MTPANKQMNLSEVNRSLITYETNAPNTSIFWARRLGLKLDFTTTFTSNLDLTKREISEWAYLSNNVISQC